MCSCLRYEVDVGEEGKEQTAVVIQKAATNTSTLVCHPEASGLHATRSLDNTERGQQHLEITVAANNPSFSRNKYLPQTQNIRCTKDNVLAKIVSSLVPLLESHWRCKKKQVWWTHFDNSVSRVIPLNWSHHLHKKKCVKKEMWVELGVWGRAGGWWTGLVTWGSGQNQQTCSCLVFCTSFCLPLQLNLLWTPETDSGSGRGVPQAFGTFFQPGTEHLQGVRCCAGNPQMYKWTRCMGTPSLPFVGRACLWVNISQHAQLLKLEKMVSKIIYILLFTNNPLSYSGEFWRRNQWETLTVKQEPGSPKPNQSREQRNWKKGDVDYEGKGHCTSPAGPSFFLLSYLPALLVLRKHLSSFLSCHHNCTLRGGN